jgi:hypothetical protein
VGRGKKRPEGVCHICRRVGPLSWEHVPPESAFNNFPIVRATQDQILTPGRWDGARGQIVQRGGGGYTLCEQCNNNTGSWYGAEYAVWAKQGLERLLRIPAYEENPFFIPFWGHPLRFLKQVITMFFSVNGEKFADIHPALVKFVLDRRATGLPPEYRVNLVLVRGGFARNSGLSGMMNTLTGSSELAAEIAHYPFALRLILDEVHGERRGAIEHFAQFGPDEIREVWLYTVAGHVATKFPGDYRSRERVDQEASQSGA